MSTLRLLAALPVGLLVPLVLGVLLPLVLAGGLLLLGRFQRMTLATRLTLGGAVLFGAGFAIMTGFATVVVLSSYLRDLRSRQLPQIVSEAEGMGPAQGDDRRFAARVAPRLGLVRTADPRIGFAAIVWLKCATDCVVAWDAPASASFETMLQEVARRGTPPSHVRVGGHLFETVSAPVRDRAGEPTALLLEGLAADGAAHLARTMAWRLLLMAWGLLALVAVSTERLISVSVSRRVRTLITKLDDRASFTSGKAGRVSDELGALSRALDAAIARSVQRERDQDTRYQELVDDAPLGICRLDTDNRIVAANPALAGLVGASTVDALLGRNIRECFARAEDAAAHLARWSRTGGKAVAREDLWRTADGAVRTVRITARLVGATTELLIEDVTEQRSLAAQLQQAQKMEALGQFTGGIAHDFNNLLTVILGNLPFVEENLRQAPDEALEHLTAVEDAASRGAALIRKLLAFSRMNVVHRESIPIAPLLQGIGSLLNRVMPEHVRLVTPTNIPDFQITADRVAVEQMLFNLAANARDAMPAGGELALDVRPVEVDPEAAAHLGLPVPGPYMVLSVRDTGTGIPEAIRARVYEPFFTTKPVGSGTGLGLAIVYGLMQQHQGGVHLDTAEGRGTTFSLYFPQVVETGADARPTPAPSPTEPKRILVVEDEPGVRRVTRAALERLGYAVDEAEDGTAALQRLGMGSYIAVVSDVIMPHLGGPGLVRGARAAGIRLPFILVSGYATENLDSLVMEDGRVWTLSKPWNSRDLAALLRLVLEVSQST